MGFLESLGPLKVTTKDFTVSIGHPDARTVVKQSAGDDSTQSVVIRDGRGDSFYGNYPPHGSCYGDPFGGYLGDGTVGRYGSYGSLGRFNPKNANHPKNANLGYHSSNDGAYQRYLNARQDYLEARHNYPTQGLTGGYGVDSNERFLRALGFDNRTTEPLLRGHLTHNGISFAGEKQIGKFLDQEQKRAVLGPDRVVAVDEHGEVLDSIDVDNHYAEGDGHVTTLVVQPEDPDEFDADHVNLEALEDKVDIAEFLDDNDIHPGDAYLLVRSG